MKKIILLVLAVIALVVVPACTTSIEAQELKSDKPRNTPTDNPALMQELVEGNSAFAFDLYQALKEKNGNLVVSPYSITEALAMTWGGARGETEAQMAEALSFLLAQNELHAAFNNLDAELAKRGEGAKGKDDEGFRLKVVNAIWGQKDFKFTAAYLDLLAQNYGAGLRVLDFIKNAEKSREIINDWVAVQTEDKIKDLLPEGSIDSLTRLVLTNAIYFNAAWLHQFKKDNTVDGKFTLLDGSRVDVRMMRQTEGHNYTEGQNYKAVELMYDGRELSMVIILPGEGQFRDFENGLDSNTVAGIIKDLKRGEVNLTMPKFKLESEFGLNDTLSLLGMPVAFSDQADFSGMDGARDLRITDVVHKAYVSVDENGTEAAAATGVVVGLTSAPAEIHEVTLDHPFVYLIRDIKTGAVLFVGRVLNPAE